jgi:hypothetical protein
MVHESDNAKVAETPAPPPEKPAGGGNGLSSGLQPSGTIPGGSPASGVGSIGTGGGSTGGASTGNAGSGG